MKNRVILIISCYLILIIFFSIVINLFNKDSKNESDKIQIIATLYPEYDFAKKIGGDKVDVTCLLGAGVEAHTYEPSVKDMKNITDSDIFVYTGDSMEPWAKTIIDSMNSDCVIVDSSKNIDLIESDEFMEEYSLLEEEHDYIESVDEHSHEYDGHIWLNPQNAIIMIENICEELVKLDPDNKEYYQNNADEYKKEILKLDEDIERNLKERDINILVFGGEFSYAYFCERYNIAVVSAYTACGEGAEPSVSKIKSIIDFINKNNIGKVFYEELSEGTVAKMISEATDAKPSIFYTLHNVSNEEINNGENYVSIMRKNIENICK